MQLTILNKKGRIWTMVAGGGASVIYSDTICDMGGAEELANYGEYSGAPSEQQTYEYAKTILSLMTQEKHPKGKVQHYTIQVVSPEMLQKQFVLQLRFFGETRRHTYGCVWLSIPYSIPNIGVSSTLALKHSKRHSEQQ